MTTEPVPLSKAHAAFDQLIKQLHAFDDPSEIEWKRYERAARESIDIDPVHAWQVLGLVASFKWDVEGVSECFEQAIAAGADVPGLANLGRALARVNEMTGAAERFEYAASLHPENLEFLRGAILYRFGAGNWKRANELCAQLAVRSRKANKMAQLYADVVDLANQIGLRETVVRSSIACALTFLRDKKLRVKKLAPDMDILAGDECVYLDFLVDVTEERARELQQEFTNVLFDSLDDLQFSSLAITIKSFDIEHEGNRVH